ncbi:hypothetical protein DL765_003021 [Monosporascus sp. GIB2]|nr:hypothetical protein DL765_003021 [Monosporascus sp. GIB2]
MDDASAVARVDDLNFLWMIAIISELLLHLHSRCSGGSSRPSLTCTKSAPSTVLDNMHKEHLEPVPVAIMLILTVELAGRAQLQLQPHTTIDKIAYQIELNRPHPVTKVVKPGHMITNSPKVVKCVWTPINVRNLNALPVLIEQMLSSRGCWMYKSYKGHQTVDETNGTYLIPYGYAAGDELVQSDGFVINKSVLAGDKGMSDIAEFCFKRLSGKGGILRKSCNGSRPTNSVRLLLSPPSDKMGKGTIEFLNYVRDKGALVHIPRDGFCSMRKIETATTIMSENLLSSRIPLEVCGLSNADFEGGEGWYLVPASDASMEELRRRWEDLWGSPKIPSVMADVETCVPEEALERGIGPVM